MAEQLRPLAAFDLDGTTFKTSILVALVGKLHELNMYSSRAYTNIMRLKSAWETNNTEQLYIDYIEAMIHSFLTVLQGRHVAELREMTTSLLTTQALRNRRFTQEAMGLLRGEYFTVAISGSPQIAAEIMTAGLPLDAVYGSVLHTEDGTFTGTGKTINKLEVIELLQKTHAVTRSGSVAFGDTINDAPLLGAVDTAICINPSATLELEARARRWHIVRESRDNLSHVTPDGTYYGVQTTAQILERTELL